MAIVDLVCQKERQEQKVKNGSSPFIVAVLLFIVF